MKKIRNLSIRIQFSKFRLSDHNLEIEKGRHKGLGADVRFCPFFKNEVETEAHFLLLCPLYTHIREHDQCFQIPKMILSDAEKFVHLMTKGSEIATFVHKAMELRNFLLSLPRRAD